MITSGSWIVIFTCIVSSLFSGVIHATVWGPDEFGYAAKNQESGGEPFLWDDILSTGNIVWQNETHNNYWYPQALPIGFEFPFYDSLFSTFFISTNGFINLDSRYGNPTSPIPTENKGFPLRTWNRSLFLSAEESVVLYQTLQDPLRCVVEFYNIDTEWPRGVLQTFEIVMYASGRIKFQYLDVDSAAQSIQNCGIDDPGPFGLSIGTERFDGEAVTFDLMGRGALQGVVTDLEDGSPMPGVSVEILNTPHQTVTDSSGYYSFFLIVAFEYDVQAFFPGFNLTTQTVEIAEGDTASLDFALPHPEIILDPSSLELELAPGAETLVQVPISNPGNGPLEFQIEASFMLGKTGTRAACFIWDLLQEINVTLATQDEDCHALTFDGELYYLAAGPQETGQRRIYLIDRFGAYNGYFQQPAAITGSGLSDLCYSNDLIYGIQDSLVIAFDGFGSIQDQFVAPANGLKALTVDPQGEIFWASDAADSLHRFDHDGTMHDIFPPGPNGISGLGYDDESFDEPWIWAWAGDLNAAAYKFDPVAANWSSYSADPVLFPAAAGGCDFTDLLDPSLGALLTLELENSADWLRAWEITPANAWLDVNPSEGVVLPGASLDLTLDIRLPDSAQQGEIWSADLLIENNSAWNPVGFSVVIHVDEGAGVGQTGASDSNYSSLIAYPNPANGDFAIALPTDLYLPAELSVFNVNGERIFTRQLTGQNLFSGRVFVSAAELPSGIYVYRIQSPDKLQIGRVCLLK